MGTSHFSRWQCKSIIENICTSCSNKQRDILTPIDN
ncbi:hypothetical protein [Bacillus phage FI_KG-Lek]|nr:hypothetical protein [Bacillus phage FI_KG-Lek]